MHLVHGGKLSGHPGMTKSLEIIYSMFYWPGMKNDVIRWIESCLPCDMVKGAKKKTKMGMVLEIPSHRFEKLSMDIMQPGEATERGNKYVLVMIDFFTKYANAKALPDHTAETVAKALMSDWIKIFGCPSRIHTDRGAEFESKLFSELCKMLEITKTRTTPFRPESDGQCERVNQTLKKALKTACWGHKNDWDLFLDDAVSAYNATPSRATKFSPHMLMFGEEKRMPPSVLYKGNAFSDAVGSDVKDPKSTEPSCYCEFVSELQESMANTYSSVAQTLEKYSERMKVYYDTGLHEREFAPGQWVIRYYKPAAQAETLGVPYKGPYVVEKKSKDGDTYTIRETEGGKATTVHINHLRPSLSHRDKPNWVKDNLPVQPEVARRIAKVRSIGVQSSRKVASVKVETDSCMMRNASTQTEENDPNLRRSSRSKKPNTRYLDCMDSLTI